MGYRSDIKAVITFKINEKYTPENLIQPLIENQEVRDNLIGDEIRIDHCKDYEKITLQFDGWKWYDDYEIVKVVDEWIDKISKLFAYNELDGGLQWIRTGEDINDNVEMYISDPIETLHFERKLEFTTQPTNKSKTIGDLIKKK